MTEQPATARERAIEAYENARDNLTDGGRKARETLGDAPLIVLAGGIAAGALIAALLPRTDRETDLVRPTAKRVKDTAKAAFEAARETGSSKLQEVGISRDKGKATLQSLIEGVADAAKASAGAAYDAARAKD
ncbi:MAG: hypothetical protein ABIS39_00065 [Sphingomicrobium sp.]